MDGRLIEIYPGEDYRDAIKGLKPGDELVLHEGVYEGAALIEAHGSIDRPVVIRGFGNGEKRPLLNWEGKEVCLWTVLGEHLVLDYLEFHSAWVYAIRLGNREQGAADITVRNCVFRECDWSFCCNYAGVEYHNIRVLNNQFIGPKSTPVYIGHHSGITGVTGFIFEGNFIDGSKIVKEDIVGYGIEIKLNVKGAVVRNNWIVNTKGPGIMVYGAEEGTLEQANLVEGNIVMGSRINPGIEVGAGPSIVRRNLVMGCRPGGIMLADYGGRQLLKNVILSENTSAGNYTFDYGYHPAGFLSENMKVTGNSAISMGEVPSYMNFNSDKFFGNFENNQTSFCNCEICKKVGKLLQIIPDMSAAEAIWLKLQEGPFNAEMLDNMLDIMQNTGIGAS